MSDPKQPVTKAEAKTDEVVLPKKVATTTVEKKDPSATMSSVGAELHPDADTKTVQGKVTLDAGGPHVSAAPQPTPAEAVSYPSTGGLPDTGPNSKYVLGDERGPELYNRDGERVDADGNLIDEFGVRIPTKGVDESRRVTDKNMMRQPKSTSPATKAEMDAGRKALANR